ncbi:redox-sensing transcriptional repressor Rex [Peptoniphilus catoniae]|uniref:redox-sensing transcriptional repressor Rex n=1 Tax=Peptoniphilus catoniae TaxID=1660341 RepID=UPI0010FDED69|nr:redox-sensing transcriptional repressor Rex [Peptoniphilus catoniae]
MNKKAKISEAVIRRLPIYHRFLNDAINKGIVRMSSSELGKLTGFTASQIRQDLHNFGGFGQQGYGYNCIELRDELSIILGMNYKHRAVLIGAGRLGSAISRYKGFRKSGFTIEALFDISEDRIGSNVDGVPILDLKDIKDYIKVHKIDVVVITTPKESVHDIIDIITDTDIKGIWNFAPVDIVLPDSDIVIENVKFNDSLLKLSYYLKQREEGN